MGKAESRGVTVEGYFYEPEFWGTSDSISTAGRFGDLSEFDDLV